MDFDLEAQNRILGPAGRDYLPQLAAAAAAAAGPLITTTVNRAINNRISSAANTVGTFVLGKRGHDGRLIRAIKPSFYPNPNYRNKRRSYINYGRVGRRRSNIRKALGWKNPRSPKYWKYY